MKKNKDRSPPKKKKAYEPPRVKRYGSFLELTQAKKSVRADGPGKPSTRLSGTST